MKLRVRFLAPHKPDIMVCACNSSTWKVEAGGSEAQDQLEIHRILSQYIKLYTMFVILRMDKVCLM